MKQSLQLRLGQQITMTPQLQQAIRLLQLSTLDLQLEIQQTLDSNMMLELADDAEEPASADEYEDEQKKTDDDEVDLDKLDTLPEDLPVDSNWEDAYDSSLNNYDYPSPPSDEDSDSFLNRNTVEQTLYDHLIWQLNLTPFSDLDRAIAMVIIDAIDEDGLLRSDVAEIRDSVHVEDLEEDEVIAVLHRIQHFDPPGVAARNLQECLLLQLNNLPADTPWLAEAKKLISDFMELLSTRDYTQLVRKMKLSRENLQQVMRLVQSLNPRPGSAIASEKPAYVVPDVFVKKHKGRWLVELNADIAPRLRVNAYYVGLIGKMNSRSDSDNMKNHLQEARWFIKSLKSRHETLLKVTHCIVERQKAFLEYGEEAMKPLVLHDIATELEMHESTISRVTTQKYIHTPRGIFELKYFFSSHVSTDNGGECSSTAIRALIKKLVAAEDTAKPLSDSKIAGILLEQGIKVARRTVAKYRESMLIPPSNERKCLV